MSVSTIAPAFLDANSGVMPSRAVIESVATWMQRGDASAAGPRGDGARALLASLAHEIAVCCGVELDPAAPNGFGVVFTSGAAESNATAIVGTARGFAATTGRMPHIITSSTEHASVLECCYQLQSENNCTLTVLNPEEGDRGRITAAAVELALRPNTCLVTIAAAHADTGAINDLREISYVTRAARIPFHTDAALVFGRCQFRARKLGIDAFSISFRKFGGPAGAGALVLRRNFVEGYNLAAQVFRAGGENIPALAGGLVALRATLPDRAAKNARATRICDAVRATIASRISCEEFASGHTAIVRWVSGEDPAVARPDANLDVDPAPRNLPNTLLMSVHAPGFSAATAQEVLEKRGVIVGVGNWPPGYELIRFSVGDNTSAEEARKFVVAFLDVVSGARLGHKYTPAERIWALPAPRRIKRPKKPTINSTMVPELLLPRRSREPSREPSRGASREPSRGASREPSRGAVIVPPVDMESRQPRSRAPTRTPEKSHISDAAVDDAEDVVWLHATQQPLRRSRTAKPSRLAKAFQPAKSTRPARS